MERTMSSTASLQQAQDGVSHPCFGQCPAQVQGHPTVSSKIHDGIGNLPYQWIWALSILFSDCGVRDRPAWNKVIQTRGAQFKPHVNHVVFSSPQTEASSSYSRCQVSGSPLHNLARSIRGILLSWCTCVYHFKHSQSKNHISWFFSLPRYRLNVFCIPPKFIWRNPKPQGNGIWRVGPLRGD